METSSIILWGIVALVAIITLGLILSKRNSHKKTAGAPLIEVPEKEYSKYNNDEDEDEELGMCACGNEAIDYYDDVAVCDSCYTKLDRDKEEEEYDDDDDGRDYSSGSNYGFGLTEILTGLVVLFVTFTIGSMILGEVGESFAVDNSTYTSNLTTTSLDGLISISSWFPTIFILMILIVPLFFILNVFRNFNDGGI